MADFVEEGGADLIGIGKPLFFGVVPDIFEPEADPDDGVLIVIAEGIGFDTGGDILPGRVFFEDDRHLEERLADGLGQFGDRSGDLGFCGLEKFWPVHEANLPVERHVVNGY